MNKVLKKMASRVREENLALKRNRRINPPKKKRKKAVIQAKRRDVFRISTFLLSLPGRRRKLQVGNRSI
jgi:hypothetical protein